MSAARPVEAPGAPPALREHRLGDFPLESGGWLRDLVLAYTLDGALAPERDNLVVIFHALTGDAQPRSWWQGVVGPGAAIDTDRWAVLCANLPGSCYGTRAANLDEGPEIGIRDMVRAVRRLVASLEVERVALVVGGSMGGMAALEWALAHPEETEHTVVFAAPAAHSAQAIAWNHVQRLAVRAWGEEGLGLARQIAMISYRTGAEFAERFGRELREDGRFQMQSYLDHQAHKLRQRFDVQSYLRLLDAMDRHDVGKGRGGVEAVLRSCTARLTAVGIPGDLLYPEEEVRAWALQAGANYREIHSVRGHDAFLLETKQVAEILREALGAPGAGREGEGT